MCNAMQIKFIREMFMKNRTNKNRGFTLVELLVVISIIALLLAVLMPALGKARKLAQRAVCMAHLGQLSLASMTYAQNNNGKFPHQYADNKTNHKLIKDPLTTTDADAQDSWIKHIFPYIKKMEHFRCPANKGNNTEDRNFPPNEKNDFSLTYNGVIAQFGGANMKRTSQTVVFYDDPSRSNMSIVRPFYYTADATAIAQIKTGRYWSGWMRFMDGGLQNQMHDGRKCFSFLDGHVKHEKWQDVTSMWFGLLISRKYIDGQEKEVSGYDHTDRTGAIKW